MNCRSKNGSEIALGLFLIFRCATPAWAAESTIKTDDIVIKFKEEAFQGEELKPEVRQVVIDSTGKDEDEVALHPMIDQGEFKELQQAAKQRQFAKNLKAARIDVKRYFVLEGEFPGHSAKVIQALNKKSGEIEKAYLAPEVSSPRGVPSPDPGGIWFPTQLYLYDAPRGVGASSAWRLVPNGACGAGMHVTDLEGGWSLNHETIARHQPSQKLVWGDNLSSWKWHGNSALGVICARDRSSGMILGITPHIASVRVVSHSGRSSRVAEAITRAANDLRRRQPGGVGGVLVIETQLDRLGTTRYEPVEVEEYIYAAILEAADSGVVVIEAAGNGGLNLDRIPALNRCDTSTFLDSGAIMVAGGSATDVEGRLVWKRRVDSNYGSRIDCFAESDRTTTAFYPEDNTYWPSFNATSSATAIIAGVALSTQGMRIQKRLGATDGIRLRTFLQDAKNATEGMVPPPLSCAADGSGAVGEWIGVMPDLMKIGKNL